MKNPHPWDKDDEALRLVIEGTASETGTEFFRALVRNLALALDTAGAWVTEYLPEEQKLRALAMWLNGAYVEHYEYALETIKLIPYDLWHEYNAEDTMRFFALRLYDAGFLKNSPNALIAEGTDWRFLDELKREMKN